MATTVHVQGISHDTSEKAVKDFFSFCGKITSLTIHPTSEAPDSLKTATVTFEKETAAKTALLLDNTQLGNSQVKVSSGKAAEGATAKAGAAVHHAGADDEDLTQEDKPRSRIVAEYLAHGYALSDNVIQQAIQLDSKHGISNRFTSALTNFDSKYKATDKAKAVDDQYKVTEKAYSAWSGFNSYFEKALGTPTGQKVRSFYEQGDKQVRDVHNEARRLADLKAGKTPDAPHEGSAEAVHKPIEVKGTHKSVCTCGGKEGVCGCAPGECACASCSKSDPAATIEAKEAAQATGQQLPAGTV